MSIIPEQVQTPDDRVEIFIPGIPVPQGSKTAFVVKNRAIVTDANRLKLKPWRAVVANAADIGVTFTGPTSVELHFYMPRPKRPRWEVPAVKPDIDKLVRAIFDGIKDGGLIEDDARIVKLVAEEHYSATDAGVGVTVVVTDA